MTRPAEIAAHLQHLAATVDAAERELHRRMEAPTVVTFAARVRRCSRAVERINLHDIANHLAEQRTIAKDGRPRTAGTGVRTLGTSTTEAIGTELARLRDFWLAVVEAMDRLHPDPTHTPHTRTNTSTEHLTSVCATAWGTPSPITAWADLRDAIDGLEASTQELRRSATAALRAHAWHANPHDINPPPLQERCHCGQHASEHHHPDTGTIIRTDLCDDCWRQLCPRCWRNNRRTPGAKECQACADKDHRNRRTTRPTPPTTCTNIDTPRQT